MLVYHSVVLMKFSYWTQGIGPVMAVLLVNSMGFVLMQMEFALEQLHALATAGMLGVAHMLYLLRAELELAMAQTGCARLDQIGPGLLTTC